MSFTKEHAQQNKALAVAAHDQMKHWNYAQLKDKRLINQVIARLHEKFPAINRRRVTHRVKRAAAYLAWSKAPKGASDSPQGVK